ncbi:UbiA family prenyltransferase [Halomonas sp. WWR20]
MTGWKMPWQASFAGSQNAWASRAKWLRLGRVSNLPTVWSNGIAGWVLTGVAPGGAGLLVLLMALSLFYVGGMYLNDAFDAEIDARERANRPIPLGEVSRLTVYILGFVMLGLGATLLFWLSVPAGWGGLALGAAIVLYDWWHKRTVLGPVIMGLCRFLVYATAALSAGASTPDTVITVGALGLFCHVVGLTYAARQEAYNRVGAVWPLAVMAVSVGVVAWMADGILAWVILALYVGWGAWALSLLFRRQPGDVPRAVVSLIAAISLYDAALVASAGAYGLAVLAVAAFGATLALQRVAPGT